jgi:hypothetical protein
MKILGLSSAHGRSVEPGLAATAKRANVVAGDGGSRRR